MCAVHKRSAVEKWNLEAVKTWATQLAAARGSLMVCADTTMTHMRDIQSSWSGAAYLAAYDRVAEDHGQVQKLALEVDELVTAVNTSVDNVASHRTTLLNKVADAQALGLTVDDVWKVMENSSVEEDVRNDHQTLINNALYPFEDSVTKAVQAISGQATEIRSAGDLLGSSLDVSAADTQAGRFGQDDGNELAEAVKTGDKAKIDEILAQMPQPALTQFEIDQLAAGNEVTTLPQSTQDYYKTFFQAAGKDGILGLNEQLLARENAGDTTAAAQRNNLANTMLAMTNEKVGTSNGSKGSYSNLPPDLQNLISGRSEDFNSVYDNGYNQLAGRYEDLSQFGELLGQSDPGMQPGKQLGVELGRQSESMVAYLENVDKNMNGQMPPGFTDSAKEDMEQGAQHFLEVATRNDDVSYSLLTGNDMPASPDIGSEYKNDRPFNAEEFRNTMFRHEWPDDGKAASGLMDWIAEDTSKQGEEGIRARQTLAELPDYFAPEGTPNHDLSESDRPPLKMEGDTSVFEKSTSAFNTNPQLSDSLANIMANNIPSYIDPTAAETLVRNDPNSLAANDGDAVLSGKDADRLLFLSSQSEGGRLMLEVARQEYQTEMIDKAFSNGGDNPGAWLEVNGANLGSLDGRFTTAINNALTYQDENNISEHNNKQTEIYDNREKAGEIIKSMTLDNIEVPNRVPGAPVANEVFSVLKDEGYSSLMEKINPAPKPEGFVPPSVTDLQSSSNLGIRQIFLEELNERGQLPASVTVNDVTTQLLDSNGRVIESSQLTGEKPNIAVNEVLQNNHVLDYSTEYMNGYKTTIIPGLIDTPTGLKNYLAGKNVQ
ncbi:WXG100 family type VII secretion target [Nocardia sp. NPDC003979]